MVAYVVPLPDSYLGHHQAGESRYKNSYQDQQDQQYQNGDARQFVQQLESPLENSFQKSKVLF